MKERAGVSRENKQEKQKPPPPLKQTGAVSRDGVTAALDGGKRNVIKHFDAAGHVTIEHPVCPILCEQTKERKKEKKEKK